MGRQNRIMGMTALVAIGVIALIAVASAKAQATNFTLRGWFVNQQTCVVKGVKVPYELQIQNVSDHTVTAKIAPRGGVGAGGVYVPLAGASPSLRGKPPWDLFWEVTLRPGQTSRVFKVSYVFPTNVFGSRDHGGVFDVRTEIMDRSNVDGALEVVAHANECLK